MMPRTPNYRMAEAYGTTDHKGRYIQLEEGEYIWPIEPRNVPQHVLDEPAHRYFHSDMHWFCFTKHGVLMLPKRRIREE